MLAFTSFQGFSSTIATQAPGAQASPRDPVELRQLIDAGQYAAAEDSALALVDAIEKREGPQAPAIADALLLALEARRFGRRMATPGTLDLAQRALRLIEAARGSDHPRVADALIFVGLAHSAARHVADAQAAVTRAIAIRERAFGADDIRIAAAWNTMASIDWDAQQSGPAMDAATRALTLARRCEDPPANETAAALALQAGVIRRVQGDLDRAVHLYEQVLAIDERLRGPDHPALAGTLLSLAGTSRDNGDVERARALHERAIHLLERMPGAERRLAFELVSISTVYDALGDYPAGLTACERAVALAEKITGPRSTLTAAAIDQLALMQDRLGDHATAAANRERTVELWTATQGAQSLHVSTALNALAESREQAGEIDAAFDVVQRALKIDALAEQPAVYARVLQTQARLLARMDRLDEARAVLERARQVSTGAGFSTARTDLATTLAQLARVERQAGQPARAIPYYREAVALIEQELGPAHPMSTTHRGELASALAEAGAYDEARALLRPSEQASLDHLRLLARATSDRRALEFAAERSSGLNLALTLATAPRVRTPADRDTAWELTIQGRTIVLDEIAARQRTVASEASNVEVRARWVALNRARARLAHVIIRGSEGQPADRYQALVDRARAERDRAEQALADASGLFRDEQRRAHAGAGDVMARLPNGATLIAYVRYTPQRLTPQTPPPPQTPRAIAGDPARGDAAMLAHVRDGVAQGIDQPLGKKGRAAGRSRTRGDDRAEGATSRVAGDPRVVPAAYAVFVARADAPLRLIPLGSAAAIDAAIAAWRERIQAELSSGGLASARTEAAYRQAGAALRALVWDPLRASIGSSSSTFIVPDGALHLVDFSTLPTGRTGYLVDEPTTLHYLLAERDLVQPADQPRGHSLLALGAPDFDHVSRAALDTLQPQLTASAMATAPADPSRRDNTAKTTTDAHPSPTDAPTTRAMTSRAMTTRALTTRAMSRSACDAFSTRTFDPLPGTRQEVQHITALWRQGATSADTTLLLADDLASETAFKALAPGRRVLHLATHGFFLDRDCGGALVDAKTTDANTTDNKIADAGSPATKTRSATRLRDVSPLLRSGLVLAGANRRTEADADDDDGVLTAEEVAGLDLSSAQWTVLSACDTGRGDWQAGEGVLGLRRAFQVAGARTVILSLWPVIDSVAADWMRALYQRKFVANASTADAVRAASRELLAARRAGGQSTHPLYWTGFIATGDWR